MKSFFFWAIERLQERSTWLGFVGVASSVGIYVRPELASSITQVGVGLASAIAVFTKDKKP